MATKKKPANGTKKAAGKPAARQIEWTRNRGKQPVADGAWVEVRLRNGTINRGPAGDYVWRIDGKRTIEGSVDIMAWRRVRKPRADKGTKLGRTLADLAASKHPRLEVTGNGDKRDCETCAHDGESFLPGTHCGVCVMSGEPAGWEPMRAPEPVRHFDRSDEMPDTLASKDGYTGMKAVGFELVAAHPLADQLDPTTPASPVWNEHEDGDRDGLGCARGLVWSVVAILAVALLAVILRGCM